MATKAVEKGEYRVLVHVIEARQLASKDRNGRSDPYVVLTLAKAAKAKTKVIKGNLNPRWDEQHIFNDVKAPVSLNVQVWDHDTFTKDDFLGQFDVHLEKSVDTDQWFTLEGRGKDEVISGQVHLRVLMESYADLQKRYSAPQLK